MTDADLPIGLDDTPGQGRAFTWRDRLERWCAIALERAQGVDFSRAEAPDRHGYVEAVVHKSSPSGDRYLGAVLTALGVRADDHIIDLGCGKGSALRVMTRFPFSAIVGVELAAPFAEVARANFARLEDARVRIVCADAARFDGYAQATLLYAYNPFPADVMAATLAHVQRERAAAGVSGELLLIYNNPTAGEAVLAAGFTPVRRFPDRWGNGIVVYSNTPHASRLNAG